MNVQLTPKDRWSFHVRFPYDPSVVQIVRDIPGCSWSKVSHSWVSRYLYLDLVLSILKNKNIAFAVHPAVDAAYQTFKCDEAELDKIKTMNGDDCMELTKIKLDPHQKVGSTFLVVGERVLLSDAVGMQKTATAINACLILKKARNITKVLYVTLSSCKWQVRDEVHRFTNERAVVMDGNKAQRTSTFENWRSSSDMFLIVNYEGINASMDLFSRCNPDVIIADEVSRTKSWSSLTAKSLRKIYAPYFWAMGATPLENNFDEIFSILRIINPAMLGTLTNFKNYYAKLGFWGQIEGWHLDRIKDFVRRIQPYILKRTNEDIGRELPKTEIKHHWLEMSDEQKRVYNDLKSQSKQMITVGQLSYSKILSVLVKLRETCDFADLGDGSATGASVKLDELIKIIREANPEDKTIVFTQWEQAAKRISARLEREGIHHVFISGSVKGVRRQEILASFKDIPTLKVLVTTDCLAWGMNLQFANRMVIFDLLYTPSKMKQRVGRIKRFGQTRPMTIHNLLCKKTVEEGMLDILAKKQGFMDLLFDPEAKNVRLTQDDLKKVLLYD